jgi:signal transduction histidine kinase
VLGTLAVSDAGDEIGDLAQLRQRAGAARPVCELPAEHGERLSHELRTPIAVVRSSLENLHLQSLPADAQVYIERAQGGIGRLSAILTRMTEATRLEHNLADADRGRVDLSRLVAACIDGYRVAYPDWRFERPRSRGGDRDRRQSDLVAQMLDKLVANAVEFGASGTLVRVQLRRDGDAVVLAVDDEARRCRRGWKRGCSIRWCRCVRQRRRSAAPGAGSVHRAADRRFHGGTARAANRDDGRGVIVTVNLPRPPVLDRRGGSPILRGST